jgi:hypothetical protein
MLATIVLPPSTERVRLGDIPRLFADAIHPEVAEGTPKVVSYLTKEAIDPDLAAEWCGVGNNFPIALTEADWDALYAGVWAGLPRLALTPESRDGPRKLQRPLPEPEWEPYRVAFEATPPTGWRLLPYWRNLVFEQWVKHNEVCKEYTRILAQQAMRGDIAPRSPTTLAPVPGAVGRHLQECFLTVPEFAEFAAKYSVAVNVQREFTRKPLAAPLLEEIRQVPPDESVVVHEAIGTYKGQAVMAARAWLEQLEEVAKRQEEGYFTVGEAAQMLADANPGVEAKATIERMASAWVGNVDTRRRLIRGTDLMPLGEGKEFREFLDLVHIEEVDEWLSRSMCVPYRLGPLVPHLSAFPSGRHLPTDVRYEIPLHPRIEPKSEWKGGRMSADELLPLREASRLASKHAGQEITERDFLRAGARGEISLRVVMPRTVTLQPVRVSEKPITLRKGEFREITPQTCEILSVTGTAHWRVVESHEQVEAMEGRLCRFECWRLPQEEDDLVSTVGECAVMGHDVHALADALAEHAQEPPLAETSPAAVGRSAAPVAVTVVNGVQTAGPVFSMTRAALVSRHEHHWQTIQSDLKNASTNGLSRAKAGARDWNESLALEWARANNKLAEEAPPSADPLAQAMRNMSSLPGRKNVLEG